MKRSLSGPKLLLGIFISSFACLLVAPSVSAQTNLPHIGVTWGTGAYSGWTPNASNYRIGADGRTWELISPVEYLGLFAKITVQEIHFDDDPIIYNNYLIQNTTGINQTYSVTISMPTTFAAPNLFRGSVHTSIIGTAATISTVAPFPIYAAQIDGVTVRTLQSNPFSLSTPQDAGGASASFGFDPNNVPVNSSMGITLTFQLTPGATAAIISDFEIKAIPEPSTLTLLLLSGGLLIWRLSRRQSVR
jgi:hypothetical protein